MTKIDIIEKEFNLKYPGILEILLLDRTSKKNIIWASNNYSRYGFSPNDYITLDAITKRKSRIINPRISKSQTEQKKRSKDMAEVFTPSWICNKQNNLIDSDWFGYPNSFNQEVNETWISTEKVIFKDKDWKEYIDLDRLEITCGEAPYLTSRYDVVSGDYIEPFNRIGLLDRKLRVISENVDNKEEWIENSIISYKRIYGYDYQGDNVLIARENLLSTFIDFYFDKFNENPTLELTIEIATIISWNIWQMDGIKFVIPDSCYEEKIIQLSIFDEEANIPNFCSGCKNGNIYQHNGKYAKIKDWRNNRIIRFVDLLK